MSTPSALIAGASIAGPALVRAPRWSHGRVALVGDAAYCPSPMTGMGTTLAVVGAYVLAGEIASHAALRDALDGYERIMRPWVEQVQKLPPGMPRMANPTSRAGVGMVRAMVRLAGTRVVGGAISRLQQGGTLGGSYSGAGRVPRRGIHIDPVRRPWDRRPGCDGDL
jgi:2-polyprenyl-6-methoxyphenol hydroxylase-like FAD-dependent oxidoreductase